MKVETQILKKLDQIRLDLKEIKHHIVDKADTLTEEDLKALDESVEDEKNGMPKM